MNKNKAYVLLLQKRLLSYPARHLHNRSNAGSQHFTRLFCQTFPEALGAPREETCSLLPAAAPAVQRSRAPCPAQGTVPCSRELLHCKKREMLPAVATSGRSRGPSEPAGAAAWQKPPSAGSEQLLNTLPLCDFHQLKRIQLSQPPLSVSCFIKA